MAKSMNKPAPVAHAAPKKTKENEDRLNREEIITLIADKTGFPKTDIRDCLTATEEVIMEQIAAGKEVTFTGFGTWHCGMVKGGIRKNPLKPTETMEVPDNMVVRFTAGMPFKRLVNGKPAAAKPGPKK